MCVRIPIKNLAQLKRALRPGTQFRVLQHMKEEMVGAVKQVHTRQTNGIYAQMAGQPEHRFSTCNGGRGLWMPFYKESSYRFEDGMVTIDTRPEEKDSISYAFEVLAEQEKQEDDQYEKI